MRIKIFLSTLVFTLAACTSMEVSQRPLHLLGDPASPASAHRTIFIGPDTRHVNVEGGEVINFVVGDKSFGWHFFVGLTVSEFDLRQVAPAGLLTRPVIAYVAPDPRYRNLSW